MSANFGELCRKRYYDVYPYITSLPDVDYIEQFRTIPALNIIGHIEHCPCRLFDVDGWIKLLTDGEIPMPYPKKDVA